jgi:coatomer subunit beta
MEFLTDSSKVSAVDVVTFVKEVMERFPHLRTSIIKSLLNAMPEMKAGRTMRGALWIIGEYALESDIIEAAMTEIRACIGALPIVEQEEEAVGAETKPQPVTHSQRVLADGTYATETAYSSVLSPTVTMSRHPLRTLVLNGEYYVMTVLATTLTKLALRFELLHGLTPETNTFKTVSMLIMTSIIRAGKSTNGNVTSQMDEDSYSRIITCIRVLSSRNETTMVQSFLSDTRQAFGKMIATREVWDFNF